MDFLTNLGIAGVNSGACWGSDSWSDTTSAGLLESISPSNGEVIAKVYISNDADYDQVINQAREVYLKWRRVPAPARGEIVRKLGNALRDHKDALGSLVALEMGNIKAEGDGST